MTKIMKMGNTKANPEEYEKTREQIHRQILSTVSHDLKTPLASIIGCLQIHTRMSDKLSAEKKEMLIQSALSEACRLDGFVSNILDMAKLESGMVPIKKEKCDIPTLLQECITRLGARGEKPDVTLNAKMTDKNIYTDPMLLVRAIGLLLDNALKHAGKTSRINMEYGHDGTSSYVHVRDNGPGVPPGKEEAIFSKYTRYANHDKQNAGTGLGLAICRQIMQLLSGTVTVKNHPEGGAVFTLNFASLQ
jgi:K+-sensing histidine kinase KdpD